MADKVKLTFRNQNNVSLAVYTQDSDKPLKIYSLPNGATYMTIEPVEECGEDPEVLVGLDPAHCSMEKGHGAKCQHIAAPGLVIRWTRRG